MAAIHICDIESAINWWRERAPSADGVAAGVEVAALADAPCIAICSTAQGDAVCKGCGRSEDEVRDWTRLSPAEKREVWRRISADGTAWRFNRYAERAGTAAG